MTRSEIKNVNCFITKDPITHDISIPINHWQLRDMLKLHPDGVVYSDINRLNIYNLKTKKRNVLLDNIGFQPTALTQYKDITIIAGNKGQLEILGKTHQKETIGNTINNAVQVYGDPPKLMVCSNDGTIKILDLETLKPVQILHHHCPINNCEVSPDGKMLIAVGDTTNVFAYYWDGEFQKYDVFRSVTDAGFKVSWNRLSTLFAISTQDGFACVWDIRFEEKLIKLRSIQYPQTKGAVRVVEFSKKGNLDLLLFTEHANYFHLIDCRNFERRQNICIEGGTEEKIISGAVFSDNCKSLFIGSSSKMYEYRLNSEIRRIFDSGERI